MTDMAVNDHMTVSNSMFECKELNAGTGFAWSSDMYRKALSSRNKFTVAFLSLFPIHSTKEGSSKFTLHDSKVHKL